MFDTIVAAVAIVAGAIAAVAGFGIGSLLTPTFAFETGTKLAVTAVAIPHFIGTLQRYWLLRQHVDRRVLLGFGLASAGGGLESLKRTQQGIFRRVIAVLLVALGIYVILAGGTHD